ncbi:unnamed protein product [Victoria cruziana]
MSNNVVIVKRVWEDNFDAEMNMIRETTMIRHPFVSLTTRLLLCGEKIPVGNIWGDCDANYSALLQTINRFRNMVQVGVALCDRMGRLPRCGETGRPCIWEFNLMPLEEAAVPERENRFLEQFCGNVNAERLRSQGIHPARMAAELWRCSLIMKDRIGWVTFKGGLDFVTLLRWDKHGAQGLPVERKEFLRLVALYFPVFYDVAAVMGFHPVADDGTIDVSAMSINMWREDGSPHGAASDSLLALQLFVRMRMLRKGCVLLEKKARVLFGVTSEHEANAAQTFSMAPF